MVALATSTPVSGSSRPSQAAPRCLVVAPSMPAVAGRSAAAVARRQQRAPARAPRRPRVAPRATLQVVAAADPQVAWAGPDAPRADAASARKVVAVVDHTAASVRAVSWALTNIYREGDVLHLLHVVPPAASMANGLTGHAASFDAGDEGEAAALLARTRAAIERAFVARCREAGATVEVDVVAQGRCNQDVSAAIIGKVEEIGAAVVVMPEQRQGLLESLFQTPVAQQVAARCRRPTVLIR
ncbi:MAG: hypothetical protein J3K34DRAFT_407679 [Monoraphidium minutum]|nr:MAG: hypothetical protein J3K34DRAFT_407679 [Monoraphidium minutum]